MRADADATTHPCSAMLTVEVDGAERMCVVKLPTDNDGSRAFAVAGNAYAKELQARAPAGTRPFLSFFGVRHSAPRTLASLAM